MDSVKDGSAMIVNASDDLEELGDGALMSFSNDNKVWSDPEPYSTTKLWNLLPGEGEKTIFVNFCDAAGNWMVEPAIDRIIFEEPQDICEDVQKILPVSVTVSSEASFGPKDNAIDGDPLTFWSSAATFFWKNEFITLDLGEIKRVSSIDMQGTKLFGIDYFPTNFQIQMSEDNLNWKELINENDYSIQSSDTKNSWDFNTVKARYIRFYITKAKTFFLFHLVRIAEVEVYGCDVSEQKLASPDEHIANQSGLQTGGVLHDHAESLGKSHQGIPSTPGKPVVTFQ